VANLIGWGKVYCSTWFGDSDLTTLSIQNKSAPPCFAPANKIVDQYVTYVANNAGTFEGYNCLVQLLQDGGEENFYDIFDTYIQRMTDDGATIQSQQCLIDQLFILN
jgi:hypothetical protein